MARSVVRDNGIPYAKTDERNGTMTISTIDLDRKLKERTATAEAVVERVKKGEGAVPKSPEVKAEAKRRAAKTKGKAAPAKPQGRKGPKYSEAEKATVKRAEALRGGNISLGPLQAKRV